MSEQLIFHQGVLPCCPSAMNSRVTIESAWAVYPPASRFNLASHTGTDQDLVGQGRAGLQAKLGEHAVLHWLQQEHTTTVIALTAPFDGHVAPPIADAATTGVVGQVCCVLTADCVPVLMADYVEPQVAAIHAGWRGLAHGIVGHTVQQFVDPQRLVVFIGPCISQSHFEVGQDVYRLLMQCSPDACKYFLPSKRDGYWMADLQGLTRQVLCNLGVLPHNISSSGLCTYADTRLPSYRSNKSASRMASLIWMSQKLRE